jgi:LCP family protein required for cell wall assembly
VGGARVEPKDGAVTSRPKSGPPGRWRTPARRRARRWTLLGLGVVLLAALPAVPLLMVRAAETGGYSLAEEVLAPTRRQVDNLTQPPTLDTPLNVLLIGSDSREGLDGEELERAATETSGGQRADSIMVAHVSPARDDIVLLSIPRDLYVEDEEGRGGRINVALSDGPGAMVDAVERLTGMDINHYVEIDFGGFMEVVDELGGVELCNNTGERLRDTDAGLDMPPGCHHMDGPGALAFVRARKIDSDFGRMARQQEFLGAVMDRVANRDILLNPTALTQTARAVSRHLSTDAGLRARTAVDLVRRIGSLSSDGIDARIYPSEGAQRCAGCAAYVYARPEAHLLTRALATDERLPPVGRGLETDVTIDGIRVELVLDHLNAEATLERLQDDLERLELDIADVEVPPEPLSSGAVLTYPQPLAQEALLIARYFGDDVRLQAAGPESRSDTIVLTVGHGTIIGTNNGTTSDPGDGTSEPGDGSSAVR